MMSRLGVTSRSWSRSSIPVLAKVALLLVVCKEIGLIHPVQCANYTVGAGFVESGTNTSTWTNTVNGLVRPGVLEAAYQQWADSVNVSVGDTLVFDYIRGQHTVFLARTESAFTNCDFSLPSAENIVDGAPTTYTIKQTDITLYFTCTVPGHCRGGQKVKIIPFGTTGTQTPSSTAAPTPSNAPQQSNFSVATIVMLLFVCYFPIFSNTP